MACDVSPVLAMFLNVLWSAHCPLSSHLLLKMKKDQYFDFLKSVPIWFYLCARNLFFTFPGKFNLTKVPVPAQCETLNLYSKLPTANHATSPFTSLPETIPWNSFSFLAVSPISQFPDELSQVRIQAWWRGIMVRHCLGQFRKNKTLKAKLMKIQKSRKWIVSTFHTCVSKTTASI